MSDDVLATFSWKTGEYTRLSGTEDWVEVAQLGDGGGYDWTEFKAFYSPAARRYFWSGASGCSCNSWNSDLTSVTDFEDGDQAALLRAWEEFAKTHKYVIPVDEYLSGVAEIRNFREPT